jgi:hypothetical protein
MERYKTGSSVFLFAGVACLGTHRFLRVGESMRRNDESKSTPMTFRVRLEGALLESLKLGS